jgi:hypothetical protein
MRIHFSVRSSSDSFRSSSLLPLPLSTRPDIFRPPAMHYDAIAKQCMTVTSRLLTDFLISSCLVTTVLVLVWGLLFFLDGDVRAQGVERENNRFAV